MERVSDVGRGSHRDLEILGAERGTSLEEIVQRSDFLPLEAVHLPDSDALSLINPAGLRQGDILRLGAPRESDPYRAAPGSGKSSYRRLREVANKEIRRSDSAHHSHDDFIKENAMLRKIKIYVSLEEEIRSRMVGI